MDHRTSLQNIRKELKQVLIERDNEIDGILSAILCKQHVLLLGPPGTAKSALTSNICKAINGANYFEYLMSKFTTPEEIFGPMSLKSIENDDFYRITHNKLPEAHIAFLDEIFKSNSAIANSQLRIINERIYDNGSKTVRCPLISMVGASNELPDSEECEAYFDRFLVKYWVKYIVNQDNLKRLFATSEPKLQNTISLEELNACIEEVNDVDVSDDIINALLKIKQETEEIGFVTSDRTWKRIPKLLKAFAYLDGCNEVTEDHLDILSDVLWREPKQRTAIATIVGNAGNPLNVKANKILDAAHDAVISLGEPTNNNRSDWMREASMVESQLDTMNKELQDLADKNKNRNQTKLKIAQEKIVAMRKSVVTNVAKALDI